MHSIKGDSCEGIFLNKKLWKRFFLIKSASGTWSQSQQSNLIQKLLLKIFGKQKESVFVHNKKIRILDNGRTSHKPSYT